MQKVVVYTNKDGSVSIMTPADPGAKALQAVIGRDLPADVDYRVTSVENIPTSRTFRAAWTDTDPTETVDIDLPRAKEIWRERIRYCREPALAALDIEFARASEVVAFGDAETDSFMEARHVAQNVVARKKVLRDAPSDPRIDKAKTVDELVKVWPEGLDRP